MYSMDSVSIDIVRETGRTSDPGNHAEILLAVTDLREDTFHSTEDGMGTTTGAPFYHLVAFKISFAQLNI
jgi:hypothetical protein